MKAASRFGLGIVVVFALSLFGASPFPVFIAPLLFFVLSAITTSAGLAPGELFRRCARVPPDKEAWHELLRRYESDIKNGLGKIIDASGWKHSRYFAEAQQEFIMRLLANEGRALRAFRGLTEYEARGYLRRIARNVALNVIRREKRHEHDELPDPDIPSPKPQPTQRAREIDLRFDLEKCLNERLHGRNKARNILMFKLFALENLKPAEIGQILGIGMSVRAIEIQIGRVREKLRKCLARK